MFKKILLAAALLATSTLALADAAPYVGASLGITNDTTAGSSYRGLPGSLLAGFGGTINQNIYLGGEVFANMFNAVLDNNSRNYSLRTTYSYGLAFLPGILVRDHSMAFGRVGVLKTRFTNLSSTSTTGGQVGLGLQTSLAQNWDVRGEYTYSFYDKVAGVSPVDDQFDLALIYKFE